MSSVPSDAPPSYAQATGSSGHGSNQASSSSGQTLQVPDSRDRNGIPAWKRRSMEDEARPLPEGWIRCYDTEQQHHFYVDTTKEPPESIWVHPYDSPEYLSTLTSEERERIEEQSFNRGKKSSKADIMAEHTDEEDLDDHHAESYPTDLPPRAGGKGKERTFGRKLKDKLTSSTHEEREQARAKRAEEERRMYEQHMKIRQAMARAAETGQPQLIGKDHEGKDLYIEAPRPYAYNPANATGAYGYGYNPYAHPQVWTTPDARYLRPPAPYARPYGSGYGRGYGTPMAIGGGLLGGMLLGGLLF